jgi:hypothetical protein
VAQHVFLHVGLPKSGTTYLQAVLGKNKDLLARRHRMLYPGAGWVDQVNAVKDIRRLGNRRQRADVRGSWAALVEEIAAWNGDAVVSMEWLCAASPEEIERMVDDLAPATVHVVYTVRDLARNVPAFWQESMQNRQVWSWPEFLEGVAEQPADLTDPGRKFWSQQDMRTLLPKWLAAVPASRTHVVTVSQSGADPDELWRRLARVLGLPEDDEYVLERLGANASIGMESAELMRRLNERARAAKVDLRTYNQVFKRRLAKRVLAARKAQESKVVLPPRYHSWVRDQAEEQIAAIHESGVEVVGDLGELRPVLPESGPAAATEPVPVPSDDRLLDAALDALLEVSLAEEAARKREARRAARQGGPRGPRRGATVRGAEARTRVSAAGRSLVGWVGRRVSRASRAA